MCEYVNVQINEVGFNFKKYLFFVQIEEVSCFEVFKIIVSLSLGGGD